MRRGSIGLLSKLPLVLVHFARAPSGSGLIRLSLLIFGRIPWLLDYLLLNVIAAWAGHDIGHPAAGWHWAVHNGAHARHRINGQAHVSSL